jgi:hypothetical protein
VSDVANNRLAEGLAEPDAEVSCDTVAAGILPA